MAVKVHVLDGAIPMIDKIMERNIGVALESLSVAGSHIQRGARTAFGRHEHNWQQRINQNTEKRQIYKSDSKRMLGYRMSYATGGSASPDNMKHMITSYLDEKNMLVVVGGMHKGFTPNERKDGVITGKKSYVKGVSKHTHSILHKLNFGERNEHHNWDGGDSMKSFEGADYVARHFMEEGLSSSQGAMLDAMTRRYEKTLYKAVNNANIKPIIRTYG
jgi:hypothetical protein